MKGYIYHLEVIEPKSTFYGCTYIGKHSTSKDTHDYYFSGGKIINRIVKKYGKKAFKRTIIVNNIHNSNLLNTLEVHYIYIYNTYYKNNSKGLNLTLDSKGRYAGYKHNEETILKMSRSGGKSSYWKNKKFPKQHADKLTNARKKPILQYDLEGNFIRKWNGAIDAARSLNMHPSTICDYLKGKILNPKKYTWKFDKAS